MTLLVLLYEAKVLCTNYTTTIAQGRNIHSIHTKTSS